MPISIAPVKTVFREISPLPIHSQSKSLKDEGLVHPCADMELNMHECYEAYGIGKGVKMCVGFHRDYTECSKRVKTEFRIFAMQVERAKKILKLEKKPSELYCPNKIPEDSYSFQTFIP